MSDEKETPTEEENDAALLGAVSDAMDEVTIDPEKDDDDTKDTEDAKDAKDADDDPSGAADDPKPEDTADKDAVDEGVSADGGTDDGGSGTDTDAKDDDDGGEAGKGEDDTKDGDDKESDPVNDPVPESLKQETQDRMQALIGIAKDNTAGVAERDELLVAIKDTGTDPDQYANTLGFLSLYNSTDPEKRKVALQVARGVVRELSVELGEGTADLLDEHKDLQDQLEAGTLTEQNAIEIATSRAQKVLSDERTETLRKTNEQASASEAASQQGRDQLTSFEASVVDDPAYQKIRPAFVGVLRAAIRNVHPSTWGEVARSIYVEMKAFAPAPEEVVAPTKDTPTPLRATQNAGGGASKESGPDSALEAIDAALSGM